MHQYAKDRMEQMNKSSFVLAAILGVLLLGPAALPVSAQSRGDLYNRLMGHTPQDRPNTLSCLVVIPRGAQRPRHQGQDE